MSRTKKSKPRGQPSKNSRAARRAPSPPLNVDSLSDLKTPRQSTQNQVFRPQDTGIRKKKPKPRKRGQRLREQKGLERAEMVMDQMELKVQKSQGKLHNIKERRQDWDNVNSKTGGVGFFHALLDPKDGIHESPRAEELRKVLKENASGSEEVWDGKGKMPEDAMPLQLPLRPSAMPGRPPPGIVGPSMANEAVVADGLEDDID